MNKRTLLILGDLLAIAVVTFLGFATHNEADLDFLPRMAATFFPLAAAWFLTAPWLGLLDGRVTANPRQLWRPVVAMVLAGPLAAVLRAFWLGGVIIPIFVVVLSGTSGLGMLVWRGLWLLLGRR
ncbi:MAG: DUF3054 domain-containing protein [Anaerolineales bacterium]